jgi:hypothetical protein
MPAIFLLSTRIWLLSVDVAVGVGMWNYFFHLFCLILLRIGICYCMYKFINVIFMFPIVRLHGSLVASSFFFKLIINYIFYLVI